MYRVGALCSVRKVLACVRGQRSSTYWYLHTKARRLRLLYQSEYSLHGMQGQWVAVAQAGSIHRQANARSVSACKVAWHVQHLEAVAAVVAVVVTVVSNVRP